MTFETALKKIAAENSQATLIYSPKLLMRFVPPNMTMQRKPVTTANYYATQH